MVRYDCHFCGENVFDVVDVEHLDTLPRTWVCSGCGREYTGELDEDGNLIVYQIGYKRARALVALAPIPEVIPEPEAVPAPGIEELAEEEAGSPAEEPPEEPLLQPAAGEWEPEQGSAEEGVAEKPQGEASVNEGAGEDTLPEAGAEPESAEEVE